LLIVEAAFRNSEQELSQKAGHYTPALLGADIAKLHHQPKIYLSHTKPGQEELIVKECQQSFAGREVYRLFGGEEFTV
jgi:ribonuclease BN (tRNA processing enzyme)